MASGGLSPTETDTGLAFWPDFFRQQIAMAARFWLDFVSKHRTEHHLLYEERPNLTKALELALELGDTWETGVDLAIAFHPFVSWARTWSNWEQVLETGLSLCRQQSDIARESVLLNQLGELKQSRGEWVPARECHEVAYQLSTRIGDKHGCARAQVNLGDVLRLQADYNQAQLILKKALSGYRVANDVQGQAVAYNSLGLLYYEQRQWDQALTCYEQAHELWTELGNPGGLAQTWHNLGNIHFARGDWAQAEQCYQNSIELYERTNSHTRLAIVWINLGNVHLRRNQPEEAETLYRQARDAAQAAGDVVSLAQVYNNLGLACARQKKWELAEEYFQRSINLWHDLEQAISLANAEDNLAEAYLHQAKWDQAGRILIGARARLEPLEKVGRVAVLMQDIDRHSQIVQMHDSEIDSSSPA